MKRYILIVLFHLLYVPVICAQSPSAYSAKAEVPPVAATTYQAPSVSYTMRSTSPMVGSGSRYVLEVNAISTSSEPIQRNGSMRRAPGDHHEEVHDDPIGDGLLPMMLLVLSYMAVRLARKRRV